MPVELLEELDVLLEDQLVAEARELAEASDLVLPANATLEQAIEVAETFVGSDEFELLDEGIRSAWKWVLGKMWKVAKAAAVVAVGPALVAPALTYVAAKGVVKAVKKLKGYSANSSDQLKGDESFTVGDVTFHPSSQNRWIAKLPGRYTMVVKYHPQTDTFVTEVEGRPLGGHWQGDQLGTAVGAALSVIANEPP